MNVSRRLGWCYGGIVGAVVVFAGCSGGGGSSPAPPTPGTTQAAPVPASTYKQSAKAIITFPHGKQDTKRRYYVSPNSTSVSVQVLAVNGLVPPSWVPQGQIVTPLSFSGSGQNCIVSNGIASCAVTIPAPPGNVEYAIQTFGLPVIPTSAPSATPSPISTAVPAVLDYGEEVIAIKQGVLNTVTITLEGVVQNAYVSLATPLLANDPTTEVMTFTAFDASGAQITGTKPFDSPFKFVDSDRYGPNNPDLYPYSTFLEVNGPPMAKQVQVQSPADVVSIVYGGVGLPQFIIEAEGKGKAGPFTSNSTITPNYQPIILPGTYVDQASPTDPNYGQNTINVGIGTTVSITPSELGYTNSPFGICGGLDQTFNCFTLADLGQLYTPCNDGIPQVATFDPPPPNGNEHGYTYTITGVTAGLCLQQFFDDLIPGHDPFPIGNPLVNGEIWVKVQ